MNEPMTEEQREGAEHPMTSAISLVLVIGVVLSAVVVAFGIVLALVTRSTGYNNALSPMLILAPQGAVTFPQSIGEIVAGIVALKPFAVIMLGLLILIATPVFRVAASILLFFLEKDYLYTAITTLVFFILLVSIFFVK